jgi:Leucine-rich repeat (LRR) protein
METSSTIEILFRTAARDAKSHRFSMAARPNFQDLPPEIDAFQRVSNALLGNADELAVFSARVDSPVADKGTVDGSAQTVAVPDDESCWCFRSVPSELLATMSLEELELVGHRLVICAAQGCPPARAPPPPRRSLHGALKSGAARSALRSPRSRRSISAPTRSPAPPLVSSCPSSLRELHLSGNACAHTDCPRSTLRLARRRSLGVLEAARCRLGALPPSLATCAALSRVDLSGNSLKSVAPLGQLSPANNAAPRAACSRRIASRRCPTASATSRRWCSSICSRTISSSCRPHSRSSSSWRRSTSRATSSPRSSRSRTARRSSRSRSPTATSPRRRRAATTTAAAATDTDGGADGQAVGARRRSDNLSQLRLLSLAGNRLLDGDVVDRAARPHAPRVARSVRQRHDCAARPVAARRVHAAPRACSRWRATRCATCPSSLARLTICACST